VRAAFEAASLRLGELPDLMRQAKLRIEAVEPTTLTPTVAIARRVYAEAVAKGISTGLFTATDAEAWWQEQNAMERDERLYHAQHGAVGSLRLPNPKPLSLIGLVLLAETQRPAWHAAKPNARQTGGTMVTELARNQWWIVIASASPPAAAQGPISVFAAGVFLKPVSQELGFGCGDISTAIAVSSIMIAAGATLFGTSHDAYSVRRPLLLSIALFPLATAAMAMLQPAFIVLLALYGLSGLLGAGQNPTTRSKMIASYFDEDRLARIDSRAIGRVLFCHPFIERRSASAWL